MLIALFGYVILFIGGWNVKNHPFYAAFLILIGGIIVGTTIK